MLTKGRLREIMEMEDRRRVLVGQLSTVGRDVRSTTMQWAYESKKLDCTVKHMSWVPPWVEMEEEDERHRVGQMFIGKDSRVVPDEVGLGRHPSNWWTMNCKYNAAYDVQRMNVKSKLGDASVNDIGAGDSEERFEFTRDNPDLVCYMLAFRTELLMRIVMPSVVKHSKKHPYMSMARAEVGPNGNPHYHGFSMGVPGPRVTRVEGDVDGEGDLPPDTLSGDVKRF